MKRMFFALLSVMSILSFTSCSLDDGVNFHFKPLQTISADLPDSFDLHQVYDIKVTFLRPDDCTLFEGFNVVRTDTTTRQVAAIGAVMEKETCLSVNQEIEDTFKFEVRYTDTYLFRFWTGDDENGEPQFLEIEVPVNQEPPNP